MSTPLRSMPLFLAVLLAAGCSGYFGSGGSVVEEPVVAPVAAVSLSPRAALMAEVEKRFDDPMFAHAFWGVVIESFDTGEVWYERNADKLFMPASNQKIPTTAAALLELGPEFRFETTLCRTGEIKEGVIEGDLVVFGNGDPTLSSRYLKDGRDVFRQWAGTLREMGVTRVRGNVIGDDNAFDDEHFDTGWPMSNLRAWYGAPFGALQITENVIDIRVVPPEEESGQVTLEPNLPSSYFELVNEVKVTAKGSGVNVSYDRPYGTNRLIVSGTAGSGAKPAEVSPSIFDPTKFYVTVLKEVLEEEGIQVEGAAVDCDDVEGWNHSPSDFTVVGVHQSPPLGEISKGLMKRSQNNFAETFVRAMAWKRTGKGTFREGRKVVQDRLAPFGLVAGEFAYMDGSGLTRYNLISPRQLAAIMRGMRQSPLGDLWYDIQPVAGVDGTLARRMKGTPAEGNVHAKTGTISNVRGLSGYVTTAAGETLVFSFLVNSHLRSERDTETITDGVLALLAAYDPAKATTE